MFFNENISNLLKVTPSNCDFGIEVECELSDPLTDPTLVPHPWSWDSEEGSLKGNGYEFLTTPLLKKDVTPSINRLKSYIESNNATILESIRASTHIHLNMTQHTLADVYKVAALYYSMETTLTRFCGEERVGNLFCLRLRDAVGFEGVLCESIVKKKVPCLYSDNYRYMGLNFNSLFKYGTLEFRSLLTDPELSKVKIWTNIIHKLRKFASETDFKVWDIPTEASLNGPDHMIKKILGPALFGSVYYEGLEFDCMKDIRNCQMFYHYLKGVGL